MAGHALAIADGFPDARIIAVEPEGADDFCRSLAAGKRVRFDRPESICDGLRSYDVGEHNWPILHRHVSAAVAIPDRVTQQAMKWIYEKHGLRTEPSGAVTTAAVLSRAVALDGEGDVVLVLSGGNADEPAFRDWIAAV
jgi:threonine dehydratase